MSRTICTAVLVISILGLGCGQEATEQPVPPTPAAQEPASEADRSKASAVVAEEGFESGDTETLQQAPQPGAEEPPEAP
jgi:hypothetical protein